jgi:hypothetical protein
LQETFIQKEENYFRRALGMVECFGGALVELQAQLIVWEECWAWYRLGGASGKLYLLCV